MGMNHLVYVREDAIRGEKGVSLELRAALADAVLDLCLRPAHVQEGAEGIRKIKHKPLLNHDNAVVHVAELHSTDEQMFVWAGNCLRSIDELDDTELDGVRKLFEDQFKKRQAKIVT